MFIAALFLVKKKNNNNEWVLIGKWLGYNHSMENYATIIKDELALCQLTKKGFLQYTF